MYPVLLRECNVITTVNFTLCIIKPRTGILYLSITFAHREEFRCRPVKNLLHHTAVTPCLYNSTPNDAATDDTTAVGRAKQCSTEKLLHRRHLRYHNYAMLVKHC